MLGTKPVRDTRASVWLRIIAMVGALGLLLAACGDDDDTDSSSDDTTTDETTDDTDDTTDDGDEDEDDGEEEDDEGAAPTGDPVKVVALFDLSSPLALEGVQEVTEATVAAVNGDGGLAGHPIELEIVDTKGDVATAQAAVDAIADDVAIVLLAETTAETAIAESLSAVGVPVVGVGYNPAVWGGTVNAFGLDCAGNPDFCAKPNFFTVTTTFDAVVAEQPIGAQLAGATKVATAACAEVDSCSQAAPVFDAVAAEIGLEVGTLVKVSASAPDYTSECVGFIQEGVDFIQISGSQEMGARLIDSCLDQGYEGIFGASAGTVSGVLLDAPGVLAGGVNGFPWWVDDAPVADYRSIMEDAGVEESAWANPTATGLYSVIRLVQTAIDDAADPSAPVDRTVALDAMYALDGEDLDGLIAPVTFSEDDLDRTRPCFWPYQKDADGNLENPLGGLTMQCYPEG